MSPQQSAKKAAPIVVNLSTSQWLAQLAEAWDKGYAEGAIAAHGLDALDNPYRVVPANPGGAS